MSEYDYVLDKISNNLSFAMKTLNWNVKQLAHASNVNATTIYRILNKKTCPSVYVLIQLANALSINIKYLIDTNNL